MNARIAPLAFAVLSAFVSPLFGDVTLQFDTSLDTSGFFESGSNALATLEAAGDFFGGILEDDLDAIVPQGRNTWEAVTTNPSTGAEYRAENLIVPADTLIIYVGGQDIPGNALAYGGPGGFSATGFETWFNTLRTRGEGTTTGSSADEVAPWGGMVSVDTGATWHDDYQTLPSSGENDLYSTLLHEIGHILGIGLADSWDNLISGTAFTGPEALAVHGATPYVTSDGSHWANWTRSYAFETGISQEASMDPDLTTGTRKLFTYLDVAALDDLGWDISVPSFQPGDVNGDGFVGSADLDAIRGAWGQTVTPGAASGDLSGDGIINSADLDIVRANWGAGILAASVPEPGTFVLLLVAAGTILGMRRVKGGR